MTQYTITINMFGFCLPSTVIFSTATTSTITMSFCLNWPFPQIRAGYG